MKKYKFLTILCVFASIGFIYAQDIPMVTISPNCDKNGVTYRFCGMEKGHVWVDLGLPSGIKWATCNVGATTPEKYGDYFAWGETTPKNYYNWGTYRYCMGSSSTMIKYCTSSSYGTVDNKTTLDLIDDAAYINWGGNWRMPTKEELDELRFYCTWIWESNYNNTGIKGYIVLSKINSNSIFLPAAGYRYASAPSNDGVYGNYWSSSIDTHESCYAYNLYFNTNDVYWDYYIRYAGQSVRPVCP